MLNIPLKDSIIFFRGDLIMGIEISGLEEFKDNLEKIQHNVENMSGEHTVKFTELFNESFMQRNTNFKSIEDMFEKSEFKVESNEDFKKIPDDKWDEYIQENTNFKDWKKMSEQAGEEYTKKKLDEAFDV